MSAWMVLAMLTGAAVTHGAEPTPTTVSSRVPGPLGQVSPEALRTLVTTADGRPRVVNFWATWCGPCVAELPLLRDWAAEHPTVEVVLVDVDLPSAASRVRAFLSKHALDTPHLTHVQLQSEDPAATLLEVVPDWPDQIPVTVVLGADGVRRALHPMAVEAAQLDAALK